MSLWKTFGAEFVPRVLAKRLRPPTLNGIPSSPPLVTLAFPALVTSPSTTDVEAGFSRIPLSCFLHHMQMLSLNKENTVWAWSFTFQHGCWAARWACAWGRSQWGLWQEGTKKIWSILIKTPGCGRRSSSSSMHGSHWIPPENWHLWRYVLKRPLCTFLELCDQFGCRHAHASWWKCGEAWRGSKL